MIYISTYYRDINFGAALQSCALQRYLKNEAFESRIISVRPNKKNQKRSFKFIINNMYNKIHEKDIRLGRERFAEFSKNNHVTTNEYMDFNDLQRNPPINGIYLSGSDQVFNPITMKPEFFLQFGSSDIKRVSYAASVAVNNIPIDKQKDFRKYLSCFDFISIRESATEALIKQYTDKEINVNVDPCFLLSKDEWNSLKNDEILQKIKKPYILVYALYRPKWLSKKLKEIRKQTKYNIILVSYGGVRLLYNNKTILNAGPAEFLSLVDNAEMIISSSYHGCVFSAIYNKPFYAVLNPESPARLESMLNLFGWKDRKLRPDTEISLNMKYDDFKIKLCIEQKKSHDYLMRVLKEEKYEYKCC